MSGFINVPFQQFPQLNKWNVSVRQCHSTTPLPQRKFGSGCRLCGETEKRERQHIRGKDMMRGTYFLTSSDNSRTPKPKPIHSLTHTHYTHNKQIQTVNIILDNRPGDKGCNGRVCQCVSVFAHRQCVYVWERSCSHNFLFLNTVKEGNVCDDGWETHTYTPLTWVSGNPPPLSLMDSHTHRVCTNDQIVSPLCFGYRIFEPF